MNEAGPNIEVIAQPGLKELTRLVAALKQVLEDIPSLGLEICDLLFSSDYSSLKPGLIEFSYIPAIRAGDAPVIELHVTDRFRELAAAAVANEIERLSINE